MDQHNSFEFFEDEEDDSKLDLIEVQKSIFTDIFNLGQNNDSGDDDESDITVADN